jgi:hypothetical protein
MSSRSLAFAIIVGGLVASGPVSGKEAAASLQNASSRNYTAEESAALGAAADRRAQAQQRKWDRRLNKISGSICDGC